jgi:hypothetical protein
VSEAEDEGKRAEGKKIIEDIAKLKYELQHDRKLTYDTRDPNRRSSTDRSDLY